MAQMTDDKIRQEMQEIIRRRRVARQIYEPPSPYGDDPGEFGRRVARETFNKHVLSAEGNAAATEDVA